MVGIFFVHLCGGDTAPDEAVDHFDLDGLRVIFNRSGEDSFIQHIAVGRFNFTNHPFAVGNILKDKRAFFIGNSHQNSGVLREFGFFRLEQTKNSTLNGIAVLIDLFALHFSAKELVADGLAIVDRQFYGSGFLTCVFKHNRVLGIAHNIVRVRRNLFDVQFCADGNVGAEHSFAGFIAGDDFQQSVLRNGFAVRSGQLLGCEQTKRSCGDFAVRTDVKHIVDFNTLFQIE